eukprot:tig00000385_g24749.t1
MVPAPLIPSAEPIFRKLVDRKLLRPEIQQIDQLRFWQCWRGATVRLYHDEFAVVVEGGPVTLIVAPAKVVQPDLAHYGLGLPPAGPAAPAALAAVAPRAPTAASSAGSAAGSGDEDDGLEQYERFLSLDTDGIFGGISADQAKDQIFGKGARANIKNLNRFLAAPFRLHYGEADGLSKVRGQNTLVIADMEDALAVLLDRTVETSSIPAKIKEKCTERMKQRLQTLNPYEKTRALLEVNRIALRQGSGAIFAQGAQACALARRRSQHSGSPVLNSKKTPPAFKYFLCIRETVKSKSTYKQGHIFPKCNKHGDPPSGCLGVYGIKQLIQDTAKLAAAQKKAAAAK